MLIFMLLLLWHLLPTTRTCSCKQLELSSITFFIPTFTLQIDIQNDRRRFMIEDSDEATSSEEYAFTSELRKKAEEHLRLQGRNSLGASPLDVSLKVTKMTENGEGIQSVFSGSAQIEANGIPQKSSQNTWILNSFNTATPKAEFIDELKKTTDNTLLKVKNVTASMNGISTNFSSNDPNTETAIVEADNNNRGGILSALIGIFLVTSAMGFVYERKRRNKSRGYEVSGDGENEPNYDIHGSKNVVDAWNDESLANTLGNIAAYSTQGDPNESISHSWNRRRTPMSKLAAGATQEEFAENGMSIDVYGQTQSKKKKKKKGSPIMNAKKGAELDTELDPIEEVNSSIAGSSLLSGSTDDKIVKGDLKVPTLLPAMSVSSCPSDENNLRECSYSPSQPPALASLTPEHTGDDDDELMTPPSEQPLSSTNLHNYTRAMSCNEGESPVRKLIFTDFTCFDKESDNSSDSGVKELLAREESDNRVVMSEEEAVKANLIAFVDDEKENKENCEEDEIMHKRNTMLRALGADDSDKQSQMSSRENVTKSNATILVLSEQNESKELSN